MKKIINFIHWLFEDQMTKAIRKDINKMIEDMKNEGYNRINNPTIIKKKTFIKHANN